MIIFGIFLIFILQTVYCNEYILGSFKITVDYNGDLFIYDNSIESIKPAFSTVHKPFLTAGFAEISKPLIKNGNLQLNFDEHEKYHFITDNFTVTLIDNITIPECLIISGIICACVCVRVFKCCLLLIFFFKGRN